MPSVMAGGGTQLRAGCLTRRQLVKRAAGTAGVMALGGGAFGATRLLGRLRSLPSSAVRSKGPAHAFVTRPDLRPPVMSVTDGDSAPLAEAVEGQVAPGVLFIGPSAAGQVQAGPLLVDQQAAPIWFRPVSRALWTTDVRRQYHRGQPVLTWWQGEMDVIGFGQGDGLIFDQNYQQVARVRAGNGRQMDIHEFLLTPEGTALFTCYPQRVPAELSAIGGRRAGSVLEGVIQEVDISTGRVVFEWHSLDHIAVSDSYFPPKTWYGYDYLHVNSIDIAPDGHLLLSARHTWALYKIHRRTGEVLWRLGGKSSDFQIDKDSQFYWQHDARQLSDRNITVFDDGAASFADGTGNRRSESQSRGVLLDIDEGSKVVRLVRSYRHPKPLLANAMGNFQTLPDGHALLGWGTSPVASEFLSDGTVISDVNLGPKHDSYRTYRYPWRGQPADSPVLAARRDQRRGDSVLYVSWNGATDVTHWIVSTGAHPSALKPAGIASRRGFETAIALSRGGGYAAVVAVDGAGRQLAHTGTVRV
jgi:hypothetical protein